eukprot:11088900-Karenia_brevis.AAC.1
MRQHTRAPVCMPPEKLICASHSVSAHAVSVNTGLTHKCGDMSRPSSVMTCSEIKHLPPSALPSKDESIQKAPRLRRTSSR